MAKKYIDAELLKKGLKELESVIYSDQLVGQSMHPYDGGQLHAIKVVKELIDSLQQEQPCEDLENAAIDFADYARKQSKDYAISAIADYDHGCIDGFKAGAEWQKGQLLDNIKLAYGKVSMNPFDCSEAFEELISKIESI